MERSDFTRREQVVEVVNRLFVYTDQRNWEGLRSEVFTKQVQFDMSSMGGKNKEMAAQEICDLWEKGFEGVDSVNHLAGNYLVTIDVNTAEVLAYATATHFKSSATQGRTREFAGVYNLHLKQLTEGWRIASFKYDMKYSSGNTELV